MKIEVRMKERKITKDQTSKAFESKQSLAPEQTPDLRDVRVI